MNARLPGIWFYQKAITDCLCRIVTAGRQPLYIGEELYCEEHKRVAIVTGILSANETERAELTAVEGEAQK